MSLPQPNAEALLQRIEWTVLRRLDGLLHGDYRTLFRGFGLDLADLREYQSHDDVRRIDWNVTARHQTLHVRQFIDDRDVTAWFLVDLSGSVDFGSATSTKRDMAIDFVATLARLLMRHGNRIGAVLYSNQIDAVIPARSGRRHVLHLLQHMLMRPGDTAQSGQHTPNSQPAPGKRASVQRRAPPQGARAAGTTNLAEFLRAASALMPRRSLVFVVSDFISTPGWEKPLANVAQRHDTVAVRLQDPLELELPDFGMFTAQDAETGEQLFVDSNDQRFRARFAAAGQARETKVRSALSAAGVDALELSTGDDLSSALFQFAALRKQRSRLTCGATTPPRRPQQTAA